MEANDLLQVPADFASGKDSGMTWRLGGLHTRSGSCGVEKNSLPSQETTPNSPSTKLADLLPYRLSQPGSTGLPLNNAWSRHVMYAQHGF